MTDVRPVSEFLGTSPPRVAQLWLHPIKSAAGISVLELTLDALGAEGDRRWMLVTPDGTMITARSTPAVVLIHPEFVTADRGGALRLTAVGSPPLAVSVNDEVPVQTVRVWDDAVLVRDAGDTAAVWCSAVIGSPCRLVRLHEPSGRPVEPRYTGPVDPAQREVMLSDGAPLLLLGQGSVDALNVRIAAQDQASAPVMSERRFRANIVLAGTTAHEEDTWSAITIGDVTIGIGDPCARCVFTTVDPDTAATGREPLRTLAEYRRQDGKVQFGMNATHAAPGTIRVGDAVRVIRRR